MVDWGGVKARIAAFEARHGSCIQEPGGGFVLFEDGAMSDPNPLGPLIEPPTDEFECARRKLRYCELQVMEAVQRFDEKKRDLVSGARAHLKDRMSGPPPMQADEAATVLKALKDTVKGCQSKHAEARAEVERLKPEVFKERERQNAENKSQNQALLDAVKGIEV